MFTKVVSTVSVLLAISAHVNGHTLMTPALGVQGAGARSDVQRLAKTGGCGNMDVASNIDTSTPVAAAADGTFTVTATNFNRLTDGSRQLTATMDSTGTGNNFNGAVTITQNGDNRPKSLGSEQIVAAIPAGTTCTGGASGNLCLVSFQNGARQGFGNCVVVSQGAAGGAAAGTGATAAGTGAATGSTATAANAGAGAATGSTGTAANAGTGASDTTAVGAATGSTGAEAGTGTATGSTGVEAGAGTGASDTSAVGAATGSTGVEAGAGTGASDNSAVGASTGSAATSGTGAISAGNTAGTGVGADVNGVASGAGVATSGSTTASTGQAISQAGSRAARALLAELEARGEDSLDLVRRGIVDWIWA